MSVDTCNQHCPSSRTVGEREAQSLDQDMKILYTIVFELENIDTMHVLHRLDDAQGNKSSETLSVWWALNRQFHSQLRWMALLPRASHPGPCHPCESRT
jgi:hypothetical protein